MTTQSTDLVNKWTRDKMVDKTTLGAKLPAYPNEFMVKLFASTYYSNLAAGFIQPGQKVLDVGCGAANNLRFFVDRGLEGHGIDVTDDFVEGARENVQRLGYPAEIVKGFNDRIPYADNFFDILISINTIHYQEGREAYLKALREFDRVVRPGGLIVISTVGPLHEFRAHSTREGEYRWFAKDYGFRSDHHFAFCDDEKHLTATLQEVFPRVETAQNTERYSTRTLDFLFAICRTKEA